VSGGVWKGRARGVADDARTLNRRLAKHALGMFAGTDENRRGCLYRELELWLEDTIRSELISIVRVNGVMRCAIEPLQDSSQFIGWPMDQPVVGGLLSAIKLAVPDPLRFGEVEVDLYLNSLRRIIVGKVTRCKTSRIQDGLHLKKVRKTLAKVESADETSHAGENNEHKRGDRHTGEERRCDNLIPVKSAGKTCHPNGEDEKLEQAKTQEHPCDFFPDGYPTG